MNISMTKKEAFILAIALVQIFLILYIGNSVLGYPIFKYLIGLGRFDDFFNTISLAEKLPDAQSSYIISPALILLFKYIPFKLGPYVFAIYNALCISVIYFSFRKLGVNKLIGFALLVSYPVLFAISRGNAELAVFAIVLLSISYFIKNEFRTALILILVAITIKPTSLIFLAIFPLKTLLHHWRIFLAAFLANILIISSLNLDILNFMHIYFIMLENYKLAYVYGTGGDLFNNSLFGLLKTGTYLFTQDSSTGSEELIKGISGTYGFLANFILLACILLVQFAKKTPFSISVWMLAASIVFLPHVSPDYRLLYLLIPISLMLIKEHCSYIENIIFYGTVILLVPKHFIEFNPPDTPSAITFQSIANPIIFIGIIVALALFILLLRYSATQTNKIWPPTP